MQRTNRLLIALWLVTMSAWGQRPEEHFSLGVRLYQTKNFSGALAEFEEAYRLRPTPSSLQNIALCQRALFRYTEAIDTLERMLREHAGAVEAEDERAAHEAIQEMQPMVATVVIYMEPPDAILKIDGRIVEGIGERRVRLNVGEHRVEAEAARYRPLEQVVNLAGGARTLSVRLETNVAELTVVAEDAEAAVAIDGVPRSFGAWTGELLADERHVIQVYRTGYTTTTMEVTLEQEERRTVRVVLGPPTADPEAKTPFPYVPPPEAPPRRGFYGLLTATSYVVAPDPDGFRTVKGDTKDGTYFGLRAGYHFTHIFALEGIGEFGKHVVGPGCYHPPKRPETCDEVPADSATYQLWGQRFGVNARFITPGERFRFVGIAGVGGVRHQLDLQVSREDGRPRGEGSALNAYLMLEAGIELSFGRALVGGMLTFAMDGINNLTIGPSSRRIYSDSRNISMAGIGLRVGYGHW